ncbi:MAG TPA: DNA-processing protein DprA [Actinomycetota bacterium]|nr:DNA-processing protein DprA [Actinomycetota bacterium]
MTGRHEQAAVLSLVSRTDAEWHRLASFIEEIGSAERILNKAWTGFESFDFVTREEAEHLADRVTPEELDRFHQLIDELAEDGIALFTVLDDRYPSNLRLVFNRPPFLFVRGDLNETDNHAIAIVGTRAASTEGLHQADRLARELASAGVTVVSGLALGIDTAAHAASIDAGGRTIAVMGTGIRRPVYPKVNNALAERIALSSGALVSQFWPDHPPSPSSFPMRNVVTSGMALGTVVIEASRTSGAKNQARRALEHGKRLFLVESLVLQEQWARDYAERPGVTVVQSVDDVLDVLVAMAKPPEQLSLS